jgi:uncharacterized membrane protein
MLNSPGNPASPSAGADMSPVVHRNIHALMEVRNREEKRKSVSLKIADRITAFAGSMWFVYLHAIWFGGWILINAGGIRGIRLFDPFPFVMLAMIASVEAIFLSTFILISQNRMQRAADRRSELDLQINLLAEHELTRAIDLLDSIAKQLNVNRPASHELEEIKKDVFPEKVIEEIEKAEDRLDDSRPDQPGNGDSVI